MKDILLFTAKRLLVLIIAGCIIGYFHQYDFALMMILIIDLIVVYIRKRKLENRKIYFFGLIITGVLGFIAEFWGVSNGFWEYHDINGREFPYWLPFAWALAFSFIYSFEKYMIQKLNITTFKDKIILALIASAILPTIGEMVTIYLGVWTYNWPFKIAGVPIYAILLLMIFHTGVNILLFLINQKWQVQDYVFSIKKAS
ncbi:hypothetical protein ACG2LH_14790 [Zhouia sp. PK063]|uniref:hypothetical protein n=1 Tax=Zhouia sp. PK063 TaxID=3373602 RepID=UPI0037AA55F0